LTVFAQPFEYETLQYARLRLLEMQRRYSTPRGDMVDVAIESGAFRHGERYVDQVVVIAFTQRRGEQLAIWSQPVYIPEGVAEEMLERRSHEPQLTAGGIINARHPLIPADNWQEFFPPGLSRHRQISEAVERALRPILG
jgi:non-canonical (house-cleaning) NTP pyrophosphatase